MIKFLWLLLIDISMGLASYGAGQFPLKSEIALDHMNLASALSMGILVGSALAAVIPEGVEMLLDSGYAFNTHSGISLSAIIGISLISGFAVMFLVDNYKELTNGSDPLPSNSQIEQETIIQTIIKSPLTSGLLLHSFVEGIALGSAFVSDDGSFQLLFLFVISIHKLPTAFSLSVVLHEEGFSDYVAKVHLIIFCLMTPISSLLTYLVVVLLGFNSSFVVGILFLFSAGTFLYSVIHVMIEVMNKNDRSVVGVSDQLTSANTHTHKSSLSKVELLLSMLGMMIPVLFTLFGAH